MKKTVELHAPDFPRSNKTVKQELALLVSITTAMPIRLKLKVDYHKYCLAMILNHYSIHNRNFLIQLLVCGVHGIRGLHAVTLVVVEYKSEQEK